MYMSYVLDFKEKQMEGTHNYMYRIIVQEKLYLTLITYM